MSESGAKPFQSKRVGARWWEEDLSAVHDPVSRRQALSLLGLLGGAVTLGGMGLSLLPSSSSASSPEEELRSFDSLEMQRKRGWNLGATGEELTFPSEAPGPYDAATLAGLAKALLPRQARLKPFYQATLFQSVAGPVGINSTEAVDSLRRVVRPIFTSDMDLAYQQGQGLAQLWDEEPASAQSTAILVDLPGPESVAFAAALARRFEPVFTFDNWPHPRGVVPAHLTLAAAVYFLPLLRELTRKRPVPAPPVFVLDRLRLEPFTDGQGEFDNRYVARLPSAAQLSRLGAKKVLYVTPWEEQLQELDDLNDDMVDWRDAGIDVRLLSASDFLPDPAETASSPDERGTSSSSKGDSKLLSKLKRRLFRFGGQSSDKRLFWRLYPWSRRGQKDATSAYSLPSSLSSGHSYRPAARTTPFNRVSNLPVSMPDRPSRFGQVDMKVRGGSISGPSLGSRSTWERTRSHGSGS